MPNATRPLSRKGYQVGIWLLGAKLARRWVRQLPRPSIALLPRDPKILARVSLQCLVRSRSQHCARWAPPRVPRPGGSVPCQGRTTRLLRHAADIHTRAQTAAMRCNPLILRSRNA